MKYILSPTLIEIANKVAQVPGFKAILKPLYYPYKNWINKKRTQLFHENGIKMLYDFDKALRDSNLSYTLACGSLLGAVREKGFIKHDLDADVFMWSEDYSPLIRDVLERNGFHFHHCFLAENGKYGREETYEKYDVSIDIFYIYPAVDKFPYICAFNPKEGMTSVYQSQRELGCVQARRLEMPFIRNRIRVPFENIQLFIPENYDELLRCHYGDNYMTPDPSWDDKASSHIVMWNDIKATFHSAVETK